MDPHAMIDAQFNRAVEIVQNLPKTGPIQTGYEDKLNMYSLFKQATMGNVQGPRPSMWELLPRAKWDAWAKHKDLDAYQAKMMYVDALLKVLRRYSDKTIAMDYVRELESYTADSTDMALSSSFSRTRSSSSSSSGSSMAGPSGSRYSTGVHPYAHASQPQYVPGQYAQHPQQGLQERPMSGDEDEAEMADEVRPPVPAPPSAYPPMNRPQSSHSSRRYRTPMASVMMSPPPASTSVPPTQPMPRYEAASAYAESSSAPPVSYTATPPFQPGHAAHLSRVLSPDRLPPPFRSSSQQPEYAGRPYALQGGGGAPRGALERAVENVQAHLAALSERMDALENIAHRSTSSLASPAGARSPRWNRGASPVGAGHEPFTFEDMGMWSVVLNPVAAAVARVRRLVDFLLYADNRSPTLVVLRRLILDVSFLLCVIMLSRGVLRRSGARRQALSGVLRAIWAVVVGHQVPRTLVDRGV